MTLRYAIYIFIAAFLLNVVWENAHSFLYLNYKGGTISEYILLRAATVDGIIILFGIFAARYFFPRSKELFLLLFWIFVAIIIERWALSTGRWEYSAIMPIIPIINIGLTPAIQLLITGTATYYFIFRKNA